ncbi:porin [Cognatishimia sp. SS12]|uniref:porin n=1 Tax=Cognatishimia sp. SS12 TaxID=2979465 RepID=UPI00232A7AE8|nr:porin [Cognatishimia sp. SS12]MDC0737920.1 porin [Cognatishimia sp. SS12]
MKKVLFASTALVLTAGVASADIAITGGADMGLEYNGTTTTVHNDIDFNIVGSGETDGGVAFGASIDLDADTDNNTITNNSGAGNKFDPEVFISYNGLKLTVGEVSSAADQGGLADLGYNGIGVDDVAEKPGGSNGFGNDDVRVDYAVGDINLAASLDSTNSDWALGGNASFDAFTVAAGFGETGGTDFYRVTLGYSAGAFGAKVHYGETGAADAWGIEGSYTTGDVTVTAVYADGTSDAYGIGVAYDLGGATLAGGIGEVANTTVADLGISFSF